MEKPLVVSVPTGGKALKLGRSASYLAAQRGDLPTIRIGSRLVVPVARLADLLGVDTDRMLASLADNDGEAA